MTTRPRHAKWPIGLACALQQSRRVAAWVQGETLEQQFGEQEVCFRTLDLYTSAVLESTLNPVVQPKQEFRSAMDDMAKVWLSLTSLLFKDGRFWPS